MDCSCLDLVYRDYLWRSVSIEIGRHPSLCLLVPSFGLVFVRFHILTWIAYIGIKDRMEGSEKAEERSQRSSIEGTLLK